MNVKRETLERAIEDLKRNLEDLKKVKEELDGAFPQSRRSDDFIQRDMEDTMKDEMMRLFRERQNIANRLFRDYPTSHPNDNFYDPNPTPVFNMGDFASRDATVRHSRYPIMVGPSTKSESRIDSTIRRVETFINQLKRKLSRRKDLKESNSFQLTEEKLKQMILEEIKNK